MAKAKAQPEALPLALPAGVRVLVGLLTPIAVEVGKRAVGQFFDWLNRRGLDIEAAARESVRAEVTEQVRAEAAAAKPEAPQP